jgi:hypothetical protein
MGIRFDSADDETRKSIARVITDRLAALEV